VTEAALGDQPARDRVRDDLDATLFVEAGAGSGKTTTLVDRVLSLIASGIPVESIAAITFTEKAAAELRDRIRQRLEHILINPAETTAEQLGELAAARGDLDAAAISTLHSFAQRILSEHPIEAGLPPGVEVFDEISSDMEFDDRWERFLLDLYDRTDLARPILLGLRLGIDEAKLRDVARAFNSNWDLIIERGADIAIPIPQLDLDSLLARFDLLTAALGQHHGAADKMSDNLELLADYRARLSNLIDRASRATGEDPEAALEAEIELIDVLREPQPKFSTGGHVYRSFGSKKNWPPDLLDDLKQQLFEAGEHRSDVLRGFITAVVKRLAAEVAEFTVESAAARAKAGKLEFHDLLVRARALLRDPSTGEQVRTALRGRYRVLLLDEFQDTDPIQIDLATLIASPADQTAPSWTDLEPDPGRLFFVGDPKQSIYRFRRADISLFLAAAAGFGPALQLNTNFRSVKPITDWVNEVFGSLLVATPESQPPYQALSSVRAPMAIGPAVGVVGIEPLDDSLRAEELRAAEARGIADAILTMLAEGWTIEDSKGITGPARLGDVTILIPARTSLPALEQALERAAIPYRAETSSLVYSTRQVRDLMAVLRAVDDPTDGLSLVSALRSAAFGCGDDDLYTFKVDHRGRWDHQAPIPDSVPAEHPVRQALEWLSDLHRRRTWMSPSEVVDTVVRERRFMEYGVATHAHRDVWRRMRFMVDQARAFSDATGGSLRDFLAWARHQADEQARVAEAVLPETDSDSVRIMTVHAAKGLEFPITILSGMTTQVAGRRAGVQVVFPPDGSVGYRFDKGTITDEFERFRPLDEQMDFHEKLRLLYVGCTRARDHLIVSLYRKAREVTDREKMTAAELLVSAAGDTAATAIGPPPHSRERRSESGSIELAPFDEWRVELATAIAASSRRHAVAATHVAEQATPDPGLEKLGRSLDLPPWKKGRYGTAIGRAVHAVLQTVDLRSGSDVADMAAAQAQAEGVAGHEDIVEALARAALGSETVAAAAAGEHWRELYVAAPLGDRLLEGYIDLLYELGDDLVVVDYKTDAWESEADLSAKVQRYRLQGASYAVAVQRVTGRRVASCRFLFLSETGAVARDIDDLGLAMEEVEALVPVLIGGGEPGVE
jgi:ATP-dependent helicase/nuclease subunit A